jgi:hypothetical protein
MEAMNTLRQRAESDLAALKHQKAEVQAQLEQVAARIQLGSPAAPARQVVAATQAQAVDQMIASRTEDMQTLGAAAQGYNAAQADQHARAQQTDAELRRLTLELAVLKSKQRDEPPKWLGAQEPAPVLKVGADMRPTRDAVMTWHSQAVAWLKEPHVQNRLASHEGAHREINKALTRTWASTAYWTGIAGKAKGEAILAMEPLQLVHHFRDQYVRPPDVKAAHRVWWALKQEEKESCSAFFRRVQDQIQVLDSLGSPRTAEAILELLGMGGSQHYARLADSHPCRTDESPVDYMRRLEDKERDLTDPRHPINQGPASMEVDNIDPKSRPADRRKCFKCDERGHMARDCPTTKPGGGDGKQGQSKTPPTGPPPGECYKCGTLHWARGPRATPCPATASSQGGGADPSRQEGSH